MVDYQKLYSKLFNEITKVIESLERVQEETFNEFVESNPHRDEIKKLVSNINFKNNNSFKTK